MQDCFRLHPEMYASELADDEDDEELQDEIRARDTADSPDSPREVSNVQATTEPESAEPSSKTPSESTKSEESATSPEEKGSNSQKVLEDHGDSVPKPAHDATQ